jgi:hypothetical protein
MTDFSLANMDYAPVKFMIKCFEANYPESLGAVLVHKSPWIFQGIWKIIRGWLDPVVANKVHFTNTQEDLAVFIEPSSIITELGGSNPWTYEYKEPVPGENDIMKDAEVKERLLIKRKELTKEYEVSVLQWLDIEKGNTEGWNQSRAKRDEIADRLRRSYWDLDPYLRAKSIYDRNGELTTGLSRPSTAQAVPAPQVVVVPAAVPTSESDLD